MQDDKRLDLKKAGTRASVGRLAFKGGFEEDEQAAEGVMKCNLSQICLKPEQDSKTST
jgi:hypothetical protein